jgi:hypothetical protein
MNNTSSKADRPRAKPNPDGQSPAELLRLVVQAIVEPDALVRVVREETAAEVVF